MTTPIWRIQIVKSLAFEQWSNDYLTDDATIEDAQDLAALLLTFEQTIHQSTVLFDYIRISSYIAHDRFFRHLTINEPGLDTAGDSLPLFNTYRLDMGTTNSDPCRKYYRAPVPEGAQTNGVVNGSVLTSLNNTAMSQLVTPDVISHIVTNKGNKCSSAIFHNLVQMRQLHRRRKKKVPA